MKLYVAGPMHGKPKRNHPLFYEVSRAVEELGHVALNPAARAGVKLGITPDTVDPPPELIHKAMALDFQDVLDSDGIVLLPGWRDSVGASAEELIARLTGKARFEFRENGLEPLQ